MEVDGGSSVELKNPWGKKVFPGELRIWERVPRMPSTSMEMDHCVGQSTVGKLKCVF